jgi:hypothetical protein
MVTVNMLALVYVLTRNYEQAAAEREESMSGPPGTWAAAPGSSRISSLPTANGGPGPRCRNAAPRDDRWRGFVYKPPLTETRQMA